MIQNFLPLQNTGIKFVIILKKNEEIRFNNCKKNIIFNVMTATQEILVNNFLRSFTDIFTLKDAVKIFDAIGIHCSERECEKLLIQNPLVFALKNHQFITRAGTFSHEVFSIKPTAREVEKGVVVIGSRCMPFIDSNILTSALEFRIEGQLVPKKAALFSSDFAIDAYQLYGEEYAPQFIASDPANESLHLEERDYLLPAQVYMTGLDVEFLSTNFGFEKGDRLLCCIDDWSEGHLNMMVLHEHQWLFTNNEVTEERINWFNNLEKLMLESFDQNGPCGSIEEQFANVFCQNLSSLCISSCGSIEEFLTYHNRKVAFESFGVESRLWRKGEEIPAVGKWNKIDLSAVKKSSGRRGEGRPFAYETPPYVLDLFIRDMLFRRSENLNDIVALYYPKEYKPEPREERDLLLHLKSRNTIIKKTYNWFKDQPWGHVRRQTLELYTRVNYLLLQIDKAGDVLEYLPQHEIIVLSQIYSNLLKMLQWICDEVYEYCSMDNALDTVEGMKWNFEEIEGSIKKGLRDCQLKKFKVY